MSESTKATIEILEHYHHNGGFYEIPVEVINTVEQEFEEKDKEIERLKEKNKILKEILGIKSPSKEMLEGKYWETKEIKRLNNIIKELEKYINETKLEEFENAYGRRYGKTFTQAEVIICNMILNKLQELKGANYEG